MTPRTIAHQAPLSMEFSRQEYWSGLLLPSPGDLPNPGIEPGSPILQTDSLLSEPSAGSIQINTICHINKIKVKSIMLIMGINEEKSISQIVISMQKKHS